MLTPTVCTCVTPFLSLAQSQAPPARNGKTEDEIKEEEELQLALALSRSEAEEQEKRRPKTGGPSASRESHVQEENTAKVRRSRAKLSRSLKLIVTITRRQLKKKISALSLCDI